MKYCTKCGHELRDDAILCPNCGCLVQAEKPVEKVADTKDRKLNINLSLFLGVYVFFDGLMFLIQKRFYHDFYHEFYYVDLCTVLQNTIISVFCILNAVPNLKSRQKNNISTLLGFIFSIAGIVLLLVSFIFSAVEYGGVLI